MAKKSNITRMLGKQTLWVLFSSVGVVLAFFWLLSRSKALGISGGVLAGIAFLALWLPDRLERLPRAGSTQSPPAPARGQIEEPS